MTFPSPEFDDAVAGLCDGRISDETLSDLHELLRDDADAQAEYLWRVELHCELGSSTLAISAPVLPKPAPKRLLFFVLAAALLGLLVLVAIPRQSPVARVTDLAAAQWMTPNTRFNTGDAIGEGERIELQSGSIHLLFASGARMRLLGPTIVEALTENSARLLLGEAHVVAETAEAKGFTLVTPTSNFVDIGTAFTASVAPDGLSRLEVVQGEVDVVLNGVADSPRLRSGETMYVEPGRQKVITRIESGDGTADFLFPSIAPPSREDYADQSRKRASVRITRGYLRERPGPSKSGPVSVLLDGKGQSKQDSPLESAFFEDGVEGEFLIDLGQLVSIETINCYSWHQHRKEPTHRHRARQSFTVYGFAGTDAPDVDLPPAKAGWTRIARVSSDTFFRVTDALDRPPQQVSSISSAEGEVGHYRYLLWVVQSPTFFGEIDIFGSPK